MAAKQALEYGRKVGFFRAADSCAELVEKHRARSLGKTLKQLQKLDILILDEVGYIPFDKTSSQLLFNVISNSYEQQSVIITSNLQFGRWNEIFGDDRLTKSTCHLQEGSIIGFLLEISPKAIKFWGEFVFSAISSLSALLSLASSFNNSMHCL